MLSGSVSGVAIIGGPNDVALSLTYGLASSKTPNGFWDIICLSLSISRLSPVRLALCIAHQDGRPSTISIPLNQIAATGTVTSGTRVSLCSGFIVGTVFDRLLRFRSATRRLSWSAPRCEKLDTFWNLWSNENSCIYDAIHWHPRELEVVGSSSCPPQGRWVRVDAELDICSPVRRAGGEHTHLLCAPTISQTRSCFVGRLCFFDVQLEDPVTRSTI